MMTILCYIVALFLSFRLIGPPRVVENNDALTVTFFIGWMIFMAATTVIVGSLMTHGLAMVGLL